MTYRYLLPGLAALALTPCSIVAAAEYLSVDAAQKAVFAQADAFEEIVMTLTPAQQQAIQAQAGPQPPHGVIRLWRAVQAGNTLGYVFIDEVIGRQNLITYAIGVDMEGALRNLEVMAYRESHGSEIKNPSWRGQFEHRTSLDQLRFRSDIKNISGSTLSSEHVTQGVRWLLAVWQATVGAHA